VFTGKPGYKILLSAFVHTLNTLKRVGTTTHGYYSKNEPHT
jgi:hypothetical protein